MLGFAHRNYTLITIIQLLLCLRSHCTFCVFCCILFVICTSKMKRTCTQANKLRAKKKHTLRCIPLCTLHTLLLLVPISFNFLVVEVVDSIVVVLDCRRKSTLCQRCKISFCRHACATIPNRVTLYLSLFYCYANGMRVAS